MIDAMQLRGFSIHFGASTNGPSNVRSNGSIAEAESGEALTWKAFVQTLKRVGVVTLHAPGLSMLQDNCHGKIRREG